MNRIILIILNSSYGLVKISEKLIHLCYYKFWNIRFSNTIQKLNLISVLK